MGLPPALRDNACTLPGPRVFDSRDHALVWYVQNYPLSQSETVNLMSRSTVYNFLDPAKRMGHLAVYIGGITIGGIVIFILMWALTKLRDWIFQQSRGVRVMNVPNYQSEKMWTMVV